MVFKECNLINTQFYFDHYHSQSIFIQQRLQRYSFSGRSHWCRLQAKGRQKNGAYSPPIPWKAASYIDSSNGIRLCTFPLRWLTIRRNPTWQQDQESMVDLVEPAHRYYFSTPEIGFKAFWEPKLSDRYQDDLWQIRDDKILTPLQWPPCCRCCHIVCLIPEYCNCFFFHFMHNVKPDVKEDVMIQPVPSPPNSCLTFHWPPASLSQLIILKKNTFNQSW